MIAVDGHRSRRVAVLVAGALLLADHTTSYAINEERIKAQAQDVIDQLQQSPFHAWVLGSPALHRPGRASKNEVLVTFSPLDEGARVNVSLRFHGSGYGQARVGEPLQKWARQVFHDYNPHLQILDAGSTHLLTLVRTRPQVLALVGQPLLHPALARADHVPNVKPGEVCLATFRFHSDSRKKRIHKSTVLTFAGGGVARPTLGGSFGVTWAEPIRGKTDRVNVWHRLGPRWEGSNLGSLKRVSLEHEVRKNGLP